VDATMTQFSGAVKLGDLNDFINPSQACIVALEGARRSRPDRISRVPSRLAPAAAPPDRRSARRLTRPVHPTLSPIRSEQGR